MKYFKSLLVIVALFAINTISAQSVTDKWPEMKNFQDLLTKVSRDAQKGNFTPLKGNGESLVQYAVAIDANKFPEHVTRTSGLTEKVEALHNETKNLNDIINIEKQSKTLNSNIISLEDNSSKLYNSIIKVEKDSNDKLNSINNNLNISEEAKIKIQEIYNIAAETGRSGEFNNRSIQLKKEIKSWELKIFLFSIILAILAISLFIFQLYLVEWKLEDYKLNFYLRFILLSPIVYYLVFSANQHNKTQKLYDKYSFKTTLAMSIKHHIEILIKQDLFIQKNPSISSRIYQIWKHD